MKRGERRGMGREEVIEGDGLKGSIEDEGVPMDGEGRAGEKLVLVGERREGLVERV